MLETKVEVPVVTEPTHQIHLAKGLTLFEARDALFPLSAVGMSLSARGPGTGPDLNELRIKSRWKEEENRSP